MYVKCSVFQSNNDDMLIECKDVTASEELVLNTLVTLHNLSFYSVANSQVTNKSLTIAECKYIMELISLVYWTWESTCLPSIDVEYCSNSESYWRQTFQNSQRWILAFVVVLFLLVGDMWWLHIGRQLMFNWTCIPQLACLLCWPTRHLLRYQALGVVCQDFC